MKKDKDKTEEIEKEDWVDYPYIGRGEKPSNTNDNLTEDDLERIIGG